MKNCNDISVVCRQLIKTAECLEAIADSGYTLNNSAEERILNEFDNICLNELEHIQRLTLVLTQLVTENVELTADNLDEGDGSAFASGELTDVLGDKTSKEDE